MDGAMRDLSTVSSDGLIALARSRAKASSDSSLAAATEALASAYENAVALLEDIGPHVERMGEALDDIEMEVQG